MKKIVFAFIALFGFGCNESQFSGINKTSKDNKSTNNAVGTNTNNSPNSESPFFDANEKLIVVGGGSQACKGVLGLDLPGITKYSPNMVPDGDFEKSSDGVTGDYSKNEYSNCSNVSSQVPAVGSYVIGNDPSQCIASWDKLEDSNIAMFNGAAAGHRFWCRTFEVEKDTKYAFSVDERLLHRDGGVTSKYGSGLIRWLVDGTVIIPVKSLEQK